MKTIFSNNPLKCILLFTPIVYYHLHQNYIRIYIDIIENKNNLMHYSELLGHKSIILGH